MSKKAVIDLGTNTFHLLIVEMKGKSNFEVVYRKRIYVKLAEFGIETIGKEPLKRAFDAMIFYKQKLEEFECNSVKAYATAALRTASNGSEFIKKVNSKTGIQIQLIDGKKEAELIFNGVKQVVAFDSDNQLVMDIGGGSTEFIIGNNSGILWSESFVAGVGVLFEKFHKTEPISSGERKKIENYLEITLAPLFKKAQLYRPKTLTGSAGAFETMKDLITVKVVNEHFAIFKKSDFPKLRDKIISSNLEQRYAIKGMPKIRAEFMPVAMILIDFVLKKTEINNIYYSAFALKEGMIFSDSI